MYDLPHNYRDRNPSSAADRVPQMQDRQPEHL